MRRYYDTEWGMPVRDERGLFERISLEAFQGGLSWATILRKRPAFRDAFADFDPDIVSQCTEADVTRLLADPGIVRNRRKIEGKAIRQSQLNQLTGDVERLTGRKPASVREVLEAAGAAVS